MKTQNISPPKHLMRSLQIVRRRMRLQQGLHLALISLSAGLLFTLLLILLGRLYPLTYPVVLLAVGLTLTMMGLLLALAFAILWPYSSLAVARLLDRRLNLDERLSTALELTADNHDTPLIIIQAQHDDTLRRLQKIDPVRAFPLHIPWRWATVAGVLVLAIVAGMLMPNPQVDNLHRRAKTEQAIAKQKEQFEEIRAELLEDEALLETPQGEELVQTLDDLIETLEKDDLSLEEALAAISEAEQMLASLQDVTAQQSATLNDMAQTFNQFDSTADLAEALQQRDFTRAAEALASAGNNLSTDPESGQELAEALRQAAQAAEQAGNTELAESLSQAAESLSALSNNPLASAQGRQELADALQQAAQMAQQAGNSELANSLNQAAEALSSGENPFTDPQARQELAEAIRQAAQQAEQAGNSELADQLNQAAQAIEQGGDPQAAQEALQQAAEALAQAGQQLANQGDVERALVNIQEAHEQLAQEGGQAGQGQFAGRSEFSTPQIESLGMGGAGREDPGLGADGLTAEQGAPDLMSTNNGPNEGRTAEYESLYAPIHLGGEGGPIVKPDEQGAEGGMPIGDAPLDPHRDPSAALVPYDQVYGEYTDAASQALDESYIPLGMKGYIRHYFGALEPGGNEE
jgi:hypothetical protein